MAKELEPAQEQQWHEVSHMQAVSGGIESGIDRNGPLPKSVTQRINGGSCRGSDHGHGDLQECQRYSQGVTLSRLGPPVQPVSVRSWRIREFHLPRFATGDPTDNS